MQEEVLLFYHTNPDGMTAEIRVVNTWKSKPITVSIHPTAFIGSGVELVGKFSINVDPFVYIGNGSKVTAPVIGADVHIGTDCRVTACDDGIGAHTVIGDAVELGLSCIGSHVRVGANVRVTSEPGYYGNFRGKVFDGCEIGNGVTLHLGQCGGDYACVLPDRSRIGDGSVVAICNWVSHLAPELPTLVVGSRATIQKSTLERSRDRHASMPVTIGDGAWVGEGSILLPGATIPDGAVVERGSKLDASSRVMVAGDATVTVTQAGVNLLGSVTGDAVVDLLRQVHTWVQTVRADVDHRMKTAEGRVRAAEEKMTNLEGRMNALENDDPDPDYADDNTSTL